MATSSGQKQINDHHHTKEPFIPKKALILTKFSRYEFEKRRHPGLDEDQLKINVIINSIKSIVFQRTLDTRDPEIVYV